ncbi:site-specific integrase [Halorarius halobius]|uniref:site-specific integrase n=1 Tax=Halorarius halobius TaxID=2962671 RepID=UPI0020CE52E7|nr:site-specific integrase [Halorarius halobius]
MRTERNKDGSWNVWMNRTEYHEIPRQATGPIEEIALRLMGDCGLRVAEVLDVTPSDISRRTDGRHYKLAVTGGKDTTGEHDGGKYRETWLPVDLEARINQVVQQPINEIGPDDAIVSYAKRTVQGWVERASSAAARETGDEDYEKVSSHDLRRCWANYLLVEENVSPRIVMALGGWSSYDAIEPYLAAPTEENIIRQMRAVSL